MRIAPFKHDRETVIKLIFLVFTLFSFSCGTAFLITDHVFCYETMQWIIGAVLIGCAIIGPSFMAVEESPYENHHEFDRFN